jgi:hypothetical protein
MAKYGAVVYSDAKYGSTVVNRNSIRPKPMPKKENILEIKVTILDKRQSAA